MDNKSYKLESSSMAYTVGFENDVIYCEMIRRLKECRLDQVTKVVQKKTSMGLGDEMSFRIYYTENGSEKKFPWIPVLFTAAEFEPFFDDLKTRLGGQVIWEDRREKGSVDERGAKVFDMQCLPFGYAGSGLNRGLQIWLYMIGLGVLVIPLFYFLIVLIKGGYRLYASDSYLEIRKLASKKILWKELEKVTFQQINVVSRDSIQTTQVVKVRINRKSGKSLKFVKRFDHAIPFRKELTARDVLEESVDKTGEITGLFD